MREQAMDGAPPRVPVNVSARQLIDPDFVAQHLRPGARGGRRLPDAGRFEFPGVTLPATARRDG
jgi:hypothetical protein